MPSPDWEDLGEFFDPADFAIKAKITRDGEDIAEVFGIFEDATEVASLGDYDLEHPMPRFTCAAAGVSAVRANDLVEIDGQTFDLFQDPKRDGTGLAKLYLSEPNVIYNAGL